MGVADVTASTIFSPASVINLWGCSKAVILQWLNPPGNPVNTGINLPVNSMGKHTKTKARPTIAGLNTFFPNPPNISFANKIAIIAPTATIHNGVIGGRERAYIPALTKHAQLIFPFRREAMLHSVKKANSIEAAIILTTHQPKK